MAVDNSINMENILFQRNFYDRLSSTPWYRNPDAKAVLGNVTVGYLEDTIYPDRRYVLCVGIT